MFGEYIVLPNRIVREAVLDSPRYMSVDENAQLLFGHLLLLADDFGCLSLDRIFIGRRCFAARPSDERLDRLVSQLADADLIRIYEFNGQPFAFIPRFRQRLKRETLKHPQPPPELLRDDPEAQEKFNQLKGPRLKAAARGPTTAAGGPPAAPNSAIDASDRSEGRVRSESSEGASPGDSKRSAIELMAEVAAKHTAREKK